MATLGTSGTAGEVTASGTPGTVTLTCLPGATIAIRNKSTSTGEAQVNVSGLHGTSDLATVEKSDTGYFRSDASNPTVTYSSSAGATLAIAVVSRTNRVG